MKWLVPRSLLLIPFVLACISSPKHLVGQQIPANLFEESTIDSPQPAVQHWGDFYRMQIEVYKCNDGLHIKKVDANGPGARMRLLTDDSIIASLEPDDHITHVDGVAVRSVEHFVYCLGQNRGRAVLTVRDRNTGNLYDYRVEANLVKSKIGPDLQSRNMPAKRVVALLIALTDDASIGKGAERNLEYLSDAFEKLPNDRVSLMTIRGRECTAANIIRSIQEMDVGPNDAFFVHYSGHGAYDKRYASGDPSNGHFLQIEGGDLLRRTLTNAMLAKRAKLTVFVSDTCNVSSMASIPYDFYTEQRSMTVEDMLPIEQLFFYHRGFLDFSGTSMNEYGWYNSKTGGWFTERFAPMLAGLSSWKTLTTKSTQATAEIYRERRKEIISSNGSNMTPEAYDLIRQQASQTPYVFTDNVTKEPIPRTGKVFEVAYTVYVPIPRQ